MSVFGVEAHIHSCRDNERTSETTRDSLRNGPFEMSSYLMQSERHIHLEKSAYSTMS